MSLALQGQDILVACARCGAELAGKPLSWRTACPAAHQHASPASFGPIKLLKQEHAYSWKRWEERVYSRGGSILFFFSFKLQPPPHCAQAVINSCLAAALLLPMPLPQGFLPYLLELPLLPLLPSSVTRGSPCRPKPTTAR